MREEETWGAVTKSVVNGYLLRPDGYNWEQTWWNRKMKKRKFKPKRLNYRRYKITPTQRHLSGGWLVVTDEWVGQTRSDPTEQTSLRLVHLCVRLTCKQAGANWHPLVTVKATKGADIPSTPLRMNTWDTSSFFWTIRHNKWGQQVLFCFWEQLIGLDAICMMRGPKKMPNNDRFNVKGRF